MNDNQQETLPPVWCIVANIVHERPYGPAGQETRRGTKHFAPGAKVYIIDFFWGTGAEDVTLVGRHRRSHHYITMTIRTKWLVNWRAELVYSPYVIRKRLEHPWAYKPDLPVPDADPLEWIGSAAAKAVAEQLIRNLQQVYPSVTQTQPFGIHPRQPNEPKEL
jgi:hypothetical protein